MHIARIVLREIEAAGPRRTPQLQELLTFLVSPRVENLPIGETEQRLEKAWVVFEQVSSDGRRSVTIAYRERLQDYCLIVRQDSRYERRSLFQSVIDALYAL